jgi:hypothetical protein
MLARYALAGPFAHHLHARNSSCSDHGGAGVINPVDEMLTKKIAMQTGSGLSLISISIVHMYAYSSRNRVPTDRQDVAERGVPVAKGGYTMSGQAKFAEGHRGVYFVRGICYCSSWGRC